MDQQASLDLLMSATDHLDPIRNDIALLKFAPDQQFTCVRQLCPACLPQRRNYDDWKKVTPLCPCL